MSKKYKHFKKTDRMEIAILLKKGYSYRDIANALKKNHSSVGREIKNNSTNGKYDPIKANNKARRKRASSKYQAMKIRSNNNLENFIQNKIQIHWTPEQIAGRWNKDKHLDEKGNPLTISYPIIYKYLYSPFGQSFCRYLTSQKYKPKKRTQKKNPKREIIPNKTHIDKRPKKVNQRRKFGHFEADTLGKIKSEPQTITGLIERMSRKILLKKVLKLKYAVNGFKQSLNPYSNTVRSVTFDNGVENVRHQELKVDTYFCNPYSSWEKGSIENAFLRLRRFIPKKSSLKNISHQKIQEIENIMNNTPRKCLNWKTPNEVFNELETAKIDTS